MSRLNPISRTFPITQKPADHRRRGRGAAGGQLQLPSPKFWVVEKLWKNLFVEKKFRPKMQILGMKTPILEKFRGKFEIFSARDFLRRKFAVFVEQWQLAARPTTPRTRILHVTFV